MTRRRDLLVLGAVFAVAIAIPPILRRRAEAFDFRPLPGFAGFRTLASGAVSAGPAFLVGFNPDESRSIPLLSTDPCRALFRDAPKPSADLLPIAVFTDYNCPNCAAFEARLAAMIKNGAPLLPVWHELPLLGPRSVWGAKVALAAKRQGAYDPVHHDLMTRVLPPGPVALASMAARHGLDPDQLWSDANGLVVEAELDAALGLGRSLGVPGTPSFVLGRTLVIGAMSERDLTRLIELERAETGQIC